MKKIIYLLMLFVMCLCITGCSTNVVTTKQTESNTTLSSTQEDKELKIYLECIDYWLKADHSSIIYYLDYDKITQYFLKLHPNATIVDYEFVIGNNASFWNSWSEVPQIIVIKYYE